jgi:formiminotetrahydrofolate cyclodeaminase
VAAATKVRGEGARRRPANPTGVETLEHYLASLASDAPVPGGGSAAAIVAASGAALVAMVARICLKNPRYAPQAELARRLVEAADALRSQLEAARERDERAFERVVAAQALPKQTPAEAAARVRTLDAALLAAAEEPLKTANLCLDVVRFAAQCLEIPNKNLVSDLGCAAEFGYAGAVACAYNVRVNHKFLRDPEPAAPQIALLKRYEAQAAQLLAHVRQTVAETLS